MEVNMKIAVLATGPTLDHLVARCLRQAIYVITVDTDTMEHQARSNDPKLLDFPLGRTLFAKLLAQDGVTALITSSCSDSLMRLLDAEGITVCTGNFGFVNRAVAGFASSEPAAAV
jgi:predicted Fe-Mo cluster-binding NifX family protein